MNKRIGQFEIQTFGDSAYLTHHSNEWSSDRIRIQAEDLPYLEYAVECLRCELGKTDRNLASEVDVRIAELEKALAPFAAMDRPGCDLKELACTRGTASAMTILTSEDFRRAAEALGLSL